MIYVLCVERWLEDAYYTKLVKAYADEELANKHMRDSQGSFHEHDVRYYVEAVRLIGKPVK